MSEIRGLVERMLAGDTGKPNGITTSFAALAAENRPTKLSESLIGMPAREVPAKPAAGEVVDIDKLLEGVGTDVISEEARAALKADPDAARQFARRLANRREVYAEAKAREDEAKAAADATSAQRDRVQLASLADVVAKAERK